MRALYSIRTKAVVLLLLVAALPAVTSLWLLMRASRNAVRTAEKQLQASILAEVAAMTVRVVRDTQTDAETVAHALGEAASSNLPEDQSMAGVRAVLATRRSIQAVRFEVPAARIDTVLRTTHAVKDPPVSDVRLRERADEHGVALSVTGPRTATLVVPILASDRVASARAAKGYVTVELDLAMLEARLMGIIDERFPHETAAIAVVDGNRRIVAAHGVQADVVGGSDASKLPVLSALPDGLAWDRRVAVVSEHDEGGVRMVGAVETVEDLGWVVAVWRPERVAYAALDKMRSDGLRVTVAALLIALLVGLLAARSVIRPILLLVTQARLIGQRRWREVSMPKLGRGEFGTLAGSLGKMASDLEQGERKIAEEARLRGDLSRYLSRDLVSAIVDGRQNLELGGQRMKVTVLFADVVAFTPLAESRSAEQVVALLNELFSLLTEIVFRHEGTVDKFIGDCLMAVWGAPVATQDHAERALAAAEDMMRFLENANELWRDKYGVEIRLAIGVNSGDAIVGNIGSDKRMEYTVIGDVVNVAARLEAIAAPNQVLVGQETEALGRDACSLLPLGERRLTGREKAMAVYELDTA